MEFLGRTKIRTKDAIGTVPDVKHRKAIIAAAGITAKDRSEVPSKQLDLMRVAPLDDEKAKQYRSAVGSAIYLSADRRDIQYATKELARRMSAPRECDMLAAKTLAAYLQSHPHIVRLVATDSPDGDLWQVESYSDSDWGRVPGDQNVNRLPRDYGSRSNRAGHHPNPTGSSCNLFSRRRTTGSVSSHRKRNHLCARVAGKGLRNRMCQTKVVDRQFLSYASEQADRTWHQATTP